MTEAGKIVSKLGLGSTYFEFVYMLEKNHIVLAQIEICYKYK